MSFEKKSSRFALEMTYLYMQDFRKLKVWAKASDLSFDVYRLTQGFPFEERFGLTTQMRRAAVSIASNIAEGCGRIGRNELPYFLGIALGSACELGSLIEISTRLGYLKDPGELNHKLDEVRKMLIGLLMTIKTQNS